MIIDPKIMREISFLSMISTLMKIEQNWAQLLQEKIQSPSIQKLKDFLKEERLKATVYPSEEDVFAAFRYSPPQKTKVVILGQDPYHGPLQAHGLSFSVRKGIRPPPSLVNIYKELESDLGIQLQIMDALKDGQDKAFYFSIAFSR